MSKTGTSLKVPSPTAAPKRSMNKYFGQVSHVLFRKCGCRIKKTIHEQWRKYQYIYFYSLPNSQISKGNPGDLTLKGLSNELYIFQAIYMYYILLMSLAIPYFS